MGGNVASRLTDGIPQYTNLHAGQDNKTIYTVYNACIVIVSKHDRIVRSAIYYMYTKERDCCQPLS